MARRPTPDHVSLTVRVPRGHEGFWRIIRDLDEAGPWTSSDVADRTNAALASVADYVRRLAKAGICAVVDARSGLPHLVKSYRLTERPTQAPRVRRDGTRSKPTGQEQMWRALRSLGAATYPELALAASTDEVTVDPVAAKTYIKMLVKAGYLVALAQERSNTPVLWRLKPSMNTGPLPPLVMRTKMVWDQNEGRVVGEPRLEEARS
ncbi:conserved hypothetical protein [Azorhizobium caulinodans ORS 571]|uniref:Uncharacterized protein n=1 Tax=Azorhizobium caulinodans (strain ATCC 43989 / DSM 5975 / JCM 20966 / LMG 6465 / NBRC 14845 / NCIMB 13405 / ORS 571) TaxID=438753 RepID=A8I7J9_AZOC5|nr:hypothetical protein [Azorhizobium caulinodans]BAF88128.1 conserved hypothetical protein [Azorhizobium caulinodans ORS 571]